MGKLVDCDQIKKTRHTFYGMERTENIIDNFKIFRTVFQLKYIQLNCFKVFKSFTDKTTEKVNILQKIWSLRYSRRLLGSYTVIAAGGAVLSYLAYTIGALAGVPAARIPMVLTTLFVVAGLGRYAHLTFGSETATKPTESLLVDQALMLIVGSWIAALYLIFSIV